MRGISIALSLVTITSCTQTHRSKLKEEFGVVLAKEYNSEKLDSDIGVTSNGDLVVTFDDQPEFWNVKILCNHGDEFFVDSKEVYTQVKENDTVLIYYYELLDEENNHYDYEFISAEVKN